MKKHVRGLLLSGSILTIIVDYYLAIGVIVFGFLDAFEHHRTISDIYGVMFILSILGIPFSIVGIVFSFVRIGRVRLWPMIVSTTFASAFFINEFFSLFIPTLFVPLMGGLQIPIVILLGIAVMSLIWGILKAEKEIREASQTLKPEMKISGGPRQSI